jgi:predicted methyltransferase
LSAIYDLRRGVSAIGFAPLETLNFFSIEPELAVVEIWPGGQGG